MCITLSKILFLSHITRFRYRDSYEYASRYRKYYILYLRYRNAWGHRSGQATMTVGSRTSTTNTVKTVLGIARFKEMSDCNVRIVYDGSVKPFGQYVARRYHHSGVGARVIFTTLYGSGTRVRQDTADAQGDAIWRVYNDYVRVELAARSFDGGVVVSSDSDDEVGFAFAGDVSDDDSASSGVCEPIG